MPVKVLTQSIQFHFLQAKVSLKDRLRLKAFIRGIFKNEKSALESLSYVFCSDQYLLEINRQFLQHDYYTDIITFNLAEKTQPVQGEIYISLDRVQDNAKSLDQYYYMELHRVIFHGVLHLCGYRDKTKAEMAIMREKEAYYLKTYFL